MSRAHSTNGKKRRTCRILVGKLEGKRTLGRLRHRLVDNITRVVRKIRFPRSCSCEERRYAGSGDTGV
jgi:hypothetical protein